MNMSTSLDFEKPIVDLEREIEELAQKARTEGIDLDSEVQRLQARVEDQRQKIYSNLTSWQKVQISRHPNRPYALDLSLIHISEPTRPY